MKRERRLVVWIAVLLLAGGGTGAAIAAVDHSGGAHTARQAAPAQQVHNGAKSLVEVAAAYLGVDVRTLNRELGAGRTLAQVARATPDRSVAGLTRTLLVHTQARLQTVAGAMSHAKYTAIHALLQRRLGAFVAGTCPLKLGTLAKILGGCHGMSM